jgi:hypothetical protein
MQMLLTSLLNHFEKSQKLSNKITRIERKSLVLFIKQAFSFLKPKGKFILENLHDQVLGDSLFSLVQSRELTFDTLTTAIQKIADEYYQKMGVRLDEIFECDTIVDTVQLHFMDNQVFMEIFHTHVWDVFFRRDLQSANRRARNLELLQTPSYTMTRSSAAIVAQNAVTVLTPFVPAHVSLFEPVEIVRVLPDPVPTEDDTTELVSVVVTQMFEDVVNEAVIESAIAFGAGNQSNVSAILDDPLDAQVLATEIAIVANTVALSAVSSAFETLEVKEVVVFAANAGESVFLEDPLSLGLLGPLAVSMESQTPPSPPVSVINVPIHPNDYFPASSKTSSFEDVAPGDAEAAAFFAAINSPIPPLPGQHQFAPQFHANVTGPLSVIPERKEDGADQSGTPPLLDGERRAPFTTFALPPLHSVEIGALGAHPKSPLSNLGSTPSSGQSGTTSTHELSELLAILEISSKSSFTPADSKPIVPSSEGTGIGVSPLAQSSGNPSGNVFNFPPPNLLASSEEPPPLPTQSSLARGSTIGVSGVRFHVGVRGNPRTNQSSFPLKGDVGGLRFQVFASSGNPPGNSGGVDHTKSPSSSKLGSNSSSSQVGTDLSASLPPPNLFGTKGKPVRPLPPTPVVPSSEGTGIGVSPGHSSSNLPGNVPHSAPPLSSKLGSAAIPRVPRDPRTKPLPPTPVIPSSVGTDIGGTKRSVKQVDIGWLDILAVHLRSKGVPPHELHLFSHLPLGLVAQGVEVA